MRNNNHSLALSLSIGSEILLPPNTRCYLDDPSSVWIVEEEEGDLFLYHLRDKEFIPIFIADVLPGHMMVGKTAGPDESCGFFFISSRHVKLRKVSIQNLLQEVAKDPAMGAMLADLLEHFIQQLFVHFPVKDAVAQHYMKLDDRLEAQKEEIVALERTLIPEEKSKLAWLRFEQGSGDLLAESSLNFFKKNASLYPLTHHQWIKTTSPATILSSSTEHALQQKGMWDGIDEILEALFVVLTQEKKKELETALHKLTQKKELEDALIEQTLLRLGSVLNDKITVAHLHEGDALFQACDLIGQSLDVKFTNVAGHALPLEEKLLELCSSCNIYFRRVSLRGKWWKTGAQPLLAFLDNHPVAIIYRKGKYYEINDPVRRQVLKMTPEIAKEISETAYVFYPGFPPGKLNIFQVAKTLYKCNTRSFVWILLVALAVGALNLFLPFANRELFDVILVGSDVTMLKQFVLAFLLISFSLGAFTLCKNFALQRIVGISKSQMYSALFGRVLQLPTAFFRKMSSGDLVNRIMSFERIRSETTTNAVNLFVTTVYCLYYLALMFFFNATFTLLGLAGLFISSILFITCIVIEVKLTKKSFEIGSTLQGFVVQIIAGIAKIRVAGAEGRFANLWGDLFSQKKKIDLKLQFVSAIERLAYRLFPMVMTSILFWAAIVTFRNDPSIADNLMPSQSLGSFIGFYTAYCLLISSVLEIFQMLFSIYGVTPFWERSKIIVQEETEKHPEAATKIKLKGGVALDHVYFRYDEGANWVLQDVSIVANPGEMIAIVGPTGCGKSTIVRLLLGFETPEQGEVLYDERDIAEYDIRSIRQQIGTVLQNEGVLGGSVYDNIVGTKTYTPEEIERALKLSGFDQDLKNLPMGLNTVMTMGGNTISGGQRQRIYLARALISSPKILILDEATSALDSKSQELVSSNLDQLDMTRIVIAHRLSTIRYADRIYVMEAGRVIESGTYKELEDAGGLFSAMLKRQQL